MHLGRTALLALGLIACGPKPVTATPPPLPLGFVADLASFADARLLFTGTAASGTLTLDFFTPTVNGACPQLNRSATAAWNGTPLTLVHTGRSESGRDRFFCSGPVWAWKAAPAPSAAGFELIEVSDGQTTMRMRFLRPTGTAAWRAPSTGTARVQDELSIEVLTVPFSTPTVTVATDIVVQGQVQLARVREFQNGMTYRLTSAAPGDHVLAVSFTSREVGLCEGVAGCRMYFGIDAGTLTLHVDP